MGIKSYNPYTPSRRNMTGSDFSEITKKTPEKSLVVSLKKNAGRNNQGKITVRHQVAVETEENTELSISRERKTVFLQRLSVSSTIRTVQQTLLLSATRTARRHTSLLRPD